ncbi:MAG: hypothetical protein LBP70_01070 [Mycoplasmataceae bacterium]|nr:hypothetical protein [Mycoplasmataceae bacterium]
MTGIKGTGLARCILRTAQTGDKQWLVRYASRKVKRKIKRRIRNKTILRTSKYS